MTQTSQPEQTARPVRTLIPFDVHEAISIREAARIAGKSTRTMRNLCVEHGIGRQVAGDRWLVSRVALAMLLDGDIDALASYRDWGTRASYEPVAQYFRRLDLAYLLDRPEFGV